MSDSGGSPTLFFQITPWRGRGRLEGGEDLDLFWGGFGVGGGWVGGREVEKVDESLMSIQDLLFLV